MNFNTDNELQNDRLIQTARQAKRVAQRFLFADTYMEEWYLREQQLRSGEITEDEDKVQ